MARRSYLNGLFTGMIIAGLLVLLGVWVGWSARGGHDAQQAAEEAILTLEQYRKVTCETLTPRLTPGLC